MKVKNLYFKFTVNLDWVLLRLTCKSHKSGHNNHKEISDTFHH